MISLVSGIYNYNVRRRFSVVDPTAVQINITYRCNSRCQMCNIWKMKPETEIDLDGWRKVLSDPIFRRVDTLLIAGGEPYLFPKLSEFIDLVKHYLPNLEKLSLISNGLMTDKIVFETDKIVEKLEGTRIKLSVGVSLDGLKEVHDKIRGIPGAFKKVEKTLIALKKRQDKHQLYLSVSGVICGINLREIEKVEKWCEGQDIPFYYQIVGFHGNYVNNLDTRQNVDFKESDRHALLAIMKRLSNDGTTKNIRSLIRRYYWQDLTNIYEKGMNRTTPCPFLIDAFALDGLGDVYYCLSEGKIGNCRKTGDVSQIYYNADNLKTRKQMIKTACLICNSGCMVTSALAKDAKKLAWFILTGKTSGSSPI